MSLLAVKEFVVIIIVIISNITIFIYQSLESTRNMLRMTEEVSAINL